DLERVLKQTVLLNEDAPSRQFLRYHKEWCSQFFRASGVLPLALQRDASGFFDDLAASDEDEPSEPLSPRERVPEGRVRADAPPGATASEGPPEGPVRADTPPTTQESDSPPDSDPDGGPVPVDRGHAPAPEDAAPPQPA